MHRNPYQGPGNHRGQGQPIISHTTLFLLALVTLALLAAKLKIEGAGGKPSSYLRLHLSTTRRHLGRQGPPQFQPLRKLGKVRKFTIQQMATACTSPPASTTKLEVSTPEHNFMVFQFGEAGPSAWRCPVKHAAVDSLEPSMRSQACRCVPSRPCCRRRLPRSLSSFRLAAVALRANLGSSGGSLPVASRRRRSIASWPLRIRP
jgi:hypothetical protein